MLTNRCLFNIDDKRLSKVIVFEDPKNFFLVSLADPNKVVERITDQLQILPPAHRNVKSHLKRIDKLVQCHGDRKKHVVVGANEQSLLLEKHVSEHSHDILDW